MSILIDLQEKTKTALKAGRKDEVTAYRFLTSELQKAAKEARGDLSPEDELKVLRRELKRRQESIAAFQAGHREDLAEHEELELRIIESFLPQQLDEGSLSALVREAIAETGANGPKDMGRVMNLVMSRGGAQVDGKTASRLAKEYLSA